MVSLAVGRSKRKTANPSNRLSVQWRISQDGAKPATPHLIIIPRPQSLIEIAREPNPEELKRFSGSHYSELFSI
jgi:hypothetical protein